MEQDGLQSSRGRLASRPARGAKEIGQTGRAGRCHERADVPSVRGRATRRRSPLPTDHRFTGQKQDDTGLLYYRARYYDKHLGVFISPDPLIPDAGNVFAYNRYLYGLGNPLKYNDPTGHTACSVFAAMPPLAIGCMAVEQVALHGPEISSAVGQLSVYAPQIPAATDRVLQLAQDAFGNGQQAGQGGNTVGPGGIDPNDPFRNASNQIRRGVDTLRVQMNNTDNWTTGRYGAQAHLSRAQHYYERGELQQVNPTGRHSIDLVLNNNVGVEVKYWSSSYLSRHPEELAQQINGFSRHGLNQIVIEFVQTSQNPVAQQDLINLHSRIGSVVDLTRVEFVIITNPGIP